MAGARRVPRPSLAECRTWPRIGRLPFRVPIEPSLAAAPLHPPQPSVYRVFSRDYAFAGTREPGETRYPSSEWSACNYSSIEYVSSFRLGSLWRFSMAPSRLLPAVSCSRSYRSESVAICRSAVAQSATFGHTSLGRGTSQRYVQTGGKVNAPILGGVPISGTFTGLCSLEQ